MAFWWVNHKQTRDHEVRGGYLWSPMRNANGAFNQTYENMRLVRPGDIVFSYASGRIGAIGRVTEAATASPKPDEFGPVGDYWSNEGWMVEVDFRPAPRPLKPAQEIQAIGPLLPDRYSPRNGTDTAIKAATSPPSPKFWGTCCWSSLMRMGSPTICRRPSKPKCRSTPTCSTTSTTLKPTIRSR